MWSDFYLTSLHFCLIKVIKFYTSRVFGKGTSTMVSHVCEWKSLDCQLWYHREHWLFYLKRFVYVLLTVNSRTIFLIRCKIFRRRIFFFENRENSIQPDRSRQIRKEELRWWFAVSTRGLRFSWLREDDIYRRRSLLLSPKLFATNERIVDDDDDVEYQDGVCQSFIVRIRKGFSSRSIKTDHSFPLFPMDGSISSTDLLMNHHSPGRHNHAYQSVRLRLIDDWSNRIFISFLGYRSIIDSFLEHRRCWTMASFIEIIKIHR